MKYLLALTLMTAAVSNTNAFDRDDCSSLASLAGSVMQKRFDNLAHHEAVQVVKKAGQSKELEEIYIGLIDAVYSIDIVKIESMRGDYVARAQNLMYKACINNL